MEQFIPKHSFDDGILKRVEHVITESDATELIVPVHQPNKCACISKGAFISKFEVVKELSRIVLEITGWIPTNETMAMVVGIKISTADSGKSKNCRLWKIISVSGLLVIK